MDAMQMKLWSAALSRASDNLNGILSYGEVEGSKDSPPLSYVSLAETMGIIDWLRRDLIESQPAPDEPVPF